MQKDVFCQNFRIVIQSIISDIEAKGGANTGYKEWEEEAKARESSPFLPMSPHVSWCWILHPAGSNAIN